MNERENILALLAGEPYEFVPIWLMGYENEDVCRYLYPDVDLPDNLSHNPERTDYPWDRITDSERDKTVRYNEAALKPAIIAGWGANMPLGHGGPGEFHFSLLRLEENERELLCETGCKRLVKKKPHFYKDFDYPLQTVEEVDSLHLPNPRDPARYKGFDEDVAWFKAQGYLTGANLNGFFSGPHYFCLDYQEFLISTLMDPVNTKKLIDMIGEWNLAAAEETLKRGAECIVLCDDLGSADNLLISPELYKDWIFPWHRELCDLAHSYNGYVHLHSHGDIRKILPLVLETGVDMLDPFDLHESMDLVAFLEEHPGCHTVPVGGLSKKFFQWDRDTQSEYLESLFSRASKAGHWMFMDPSGIPETLERDSYLFFLDKLKTLSGR